MSAATILIIETNEACAGVAARALIPQGHGLLIAKNEPQGLKLLKRCQPDLVLVEDSPVNNPLRWLEKIESLHLPAQLLAVTGRPVFETAMEWVARGVFTVLAQPLQEEKLLKAVNLALEQRDTLSGLVHLCAGDQAAGRPADDSPMLNFYQGLLKHLEVRDLARYLSRSLRAITRAGRVELHLADCFGPQPGAKNAADAAPVENLAPCRLLLETQEQVLGELVLYFENQETLARQDVQLLEQLSEAAAAGLNQALQYQKAVNLASRDSLTGLFNRRIFTETLKREFAEAQRRHQPLSLLIIDLDYFKAVNDNFGHQTGDDVLKAVAGVIAEVCRVADLPARIGGEEFAVILPQTTQEQAFYMAERLKRALAENTSSPAIALVRQTVSQGVAEREHFLVNSPEDLVYWADRALYLAKHEGRDTIRLATELPLKTTIKDGQYVFQ